MKFLNKRWVSLVLCILMIAAAIGITASKNRSSSYQPEDPYTAEAWGEEYYGSYVRFVDDRADVLSDETIRQISIKNVAFDYSHSSICGVVVVKSVGSKTMEDAAYDYSEELQLGDFDSLLLIDLSAEDWYFVYGAEFSYYVDHELEMIFRSALDGAFDDLDDGLIMLFNQLAPWFENNMPLSDSEKISAGNSTGSTQFVTVLVVLLIIIMILSSIARVSRRRYNVWGPTVFLGGYDRRRNIFHGPGPGHGPRPPHNSRSTSHRPSGRAGGFGGSSRGSGFGGRSGGFGGGSRGGGFGGRR